MYGEPDYGYWNGDGYLNLSGTRKRITNNYVVDDTPSDYIFSTVLDLSSIPSKYIQNIRFETTVDETEQVVASVCTAEEWLAMSEAERSNYLRSHPLYDADKEAVYYSTTATTYLGMCGTHHDDSGDKKIWGNLQMSYVGKTSGSGIAEYLTWWDSATEYVDKIFFNGYISISTKYFKGYNSSGSMITTSQTSHSPATSDIKFQYHISYPWEISQDGYPLSPDFLEVPIKTIAPPIPKGIWFVETEINDGYPFMGLLPPVDIFGAFGNAVNLQFVNIPQTVTSIGSDAFKGTQLQQVTIAQDCSYESTSFPPNCIINRY